MVHVHAGGLNFADVMTTKGGYPGTPPPPLIVGREFAGVEESDGTSRDGIRPVGGLRRKDCRLSQHALDRSPALERRTGRCVPGQLLHRLPGILAGGDDPAAGRRAVTIGSLIHAVAGGVGTAAVQIGHLLGVEMYGTSSSDEKLARVKELGLQHGINYKQHDYEEVVKNLTHGEGVDAVFEMLGGEHTAKSLRCLRDFGRVIQYGTATGKPPQLDCAPCTRNRPACKGCG